MEGGGGGGGWVKWRKAILAASFWASLEDLQGLEEWKVWGGELELIMTVAVAVKRGLWSGPSFVLTYSGKLHDFWWHSSCSFDLYISLSLSLSLSSPSYAFAFAITARVIQFKIKMIMYVHGWMGLTVSHYFFIWALISWGLPRHLGSNKSYINGKNCSKKRQ